MGGKGGGFATEVIKSTEGIGEKQEANRGLRGWGAHSSLTIDAHKKRLGYRSQAFCFLGAVCG
ncbi:hypothetical protein C5Y96_18140 [Blastopirellula marina]|uniref:Uncharacterized protein n=1 Tax=Blastopirellula marina TaxID=124 RepID=A0A2S8F5N3_9BACT|nr:hypothetical protein C5Y96_18140 [Blastopirellula marina]RCS47994.1 hypothetical protein DTL36_18165 [Bremerella cremea]